MNPSPAHNERPDIFDRLMHLPLLRLLEPFYRKHREVLLYLFFGAVTTVISLGSFWLFDSVVGWDPLIANPLSWVLAVLVAFLTNRIWVFHAPTKGLRAFLLQMLTFYAGRVLTLLFEQAVIAIFVTWLSLPSFPVKLAASILVVILNYILSKILIFRKRKKNGEAPDNC